MVYSVFRARGSSFENFQGWCLFTRSSLIPKVGLLVGDLCLFLRLLHYRQFVCYYNNKDPGQIEGLHHWPWMSLIISPSFLCSYFLSSLSPSSHTHTPLLHFSQSSYKQRFVVLKMGGEGRGKLVEVWDSQTSEKDPYRLVLGNSWTVQTKPSNSGKRYAFQVNVTAVHDHDLIV